jgi:hypothetical protein
MLDGCPCLAWQTTTLGILPRALGIAPIGPPRTSCDAAKSPAFADQESSSEAASASHRFLQPCSDGDPAGLLRWGSANVLRGPRGGTSQCHCSSLFARIAWN